MWILARIFEFSDGQQYLPERREPHRIKLIDVNHLWVQPVHPKGDAQVLGFILVATTPLSHGDCNTDYITPVMAEDKAMLVLREILAASSTGADVIAILSRVAPEAVADFDARVIHIPVHVPKSSKGSSNSGQADEDWDPFADV